MLPAGSKTNLMSGITDAVTRHFQTGCNCLLAQNFSGRLDRKQGAGVGWEIFDAETAGRIRARGEQIARRFANNIIGRARIIADDLHFAKSLADGNLRIGHRLIGFVQNGASQRARRR